MTVKSSGFFFALVVSLAGVSFSASAQNVAVVNGKAIPSSRVDVMIKQMTSQGQKDSPQLRALVKEELINREILIQEAEKQGLASSSEVKNQIEMARQSILIQAFVNDFIKKHPVSEAAAKVEYEKFKAQAGDKEYHVRHILVEKEEDAKAIITKLKGGAKFEDLAKKSKDTGSAANGGDLDWALPVSFVKPFSDAMVALQKGQMTDEPVKTQFGYHVIRVDDIRPAKVPGFDEVKPQVTESIQQKQLLEYQKELRSKAKVQ